VSRSSLLFSSLLVSAAFLSVGCAAKRPVAAAPAAPPAANPNPVPPSPSARSPKTPSAIAPGSYTEEGNASWYGKPFNGRRASNGETYDMYKLTAAHRTLPFDTMVRVTNLNNGKSTTVRIIDRGPFVDNRVIDLSLAAAREIDSVGPGVVPVRLEVIGDVDVTGGFFTVQVGAFHERSNAERLRDRLSLTYTPIFIQQYSSSEGTFYRLRVGKISGEEAANDLAAQLRAREGFTTLVFRLDETKSSGAN
jgi:rare lipoprotein A